MLCAPNVFDKDSSNRKMKARNQMAVVVRKRERKKPGMRVNHPDG
jgi:hypothetical protein